MYASCIVHVLDGTVSFNSNKLVWTHCNSFAYLSKVHAGWTFGCWLSFNRNCCQCPSHAGTPLNNSILVNVPCCYNNRRKSGLRWDGTQPIRKNGFWTPGRLDAWSLMRLQPWQYNLSFCPLLLFVLALISCLLQSESVCNAALTQASMKERNCDIRTKDQARDKRAAYWNWKGVSNL